MDPQGHASQSLPSGAVLESFGPSLFVARQYEPALAALQRIRQPDGSQLALIAASQAALGHEPQAAAAAAEIVRRMPAFSVDDHVATQHYKEVGDREHYRAALLRAGLPP